MIMIYIIASHTKIHQETNENKNKASLLPWVARDSLSQLFSKRELLATSTTSRVGTISLSLE